MTEMIHQQYLDVENVLDKLQQLSLFNNSSKTKIDELPKQYFDIEHVA